MTSLAQNLGKETVAEGVETMSHLEALNELGVDIAQGFLVSAPVPAAAAEQMLEVIENAPNHLQALFEHRQAG